ncbi:MAG: hypothetical protein HJJLKODD_02531 [Phycisphaerae bacterium]|nr:hypothetical protein [Phycisphaerae bacterium]
MTGWSIRKKNQAGIVSIILLCGLRLLTGCAADVPLNSNVTGPSTPAAGTTNQNIDLPADPLSGADDEAIPPASIASPSTEEAIVLAVRLSDSITVHSGELVVLAGEVTSSVDNNLLDYRWRQTGGKPKINLIGALTGELSFVAPHVTQPKSIELELAISYQQQSASDRIMIQVQPVTGDGSGSSITEPPADSEEFESSEITDPQGDIETPLVPELPAVPPGGGGGGDSGGFSPPGIVPPPADPPPIECDPIDTDGDFINDCEDDCPTDPYKSAPGFCGCEQPEWPDCQSPAGSFSVTTTFEDNTIRMVDDLTGIPLMDPDYCPVESWMVGRKLYVHTDGGLGDQVIEPVITMQAVPTGYDLTYTFTNSSASPKSMGAIAVSGLALGRTIHWKDFTYVGSDVQSVFDHYYLQSRNYPVFWYSPVWVLTDERYAVGISLQYPMIEYQHDVRLSMYPRHVGTAEVGDCGSDVHKGWEIQFALQNFGWEGQWDRLQYGTPMVPPGETRTYVVSVRVTNKPDEWVRTLVPYRDFFRATYGEVAYCRQGWPTRVETAATMSSISADNPYGFTYGSSLRPDRFGWGPWANYLRNQLDGWPAVLLWKCSGQYNQSIYNMPFKITSRWSEDPDIQVRANLLTAYNTDLGLPIVEETKQFGLWWGYSASVHTAWNPRDDQVFSLDPDNPDLAARAFAELDGAVAAGATMIGLDTYNHAFCPIWKLYPWLLSMQTRHPEVTFISEPRGADVLHRLAPTFFYAANYAPLDRSEDLLAIHEPFVYADFLLPGHETFAYFTYGGNFVAAFGMPTEQHVYQDIRRCAALGYRPIIALPIPMYEFTMQDDYLAQPTWETSVPIDLQISPPAICSP